jgi:hypothetical protein
VSSFIHARSAIEAPAFSQAWRDGTGTYAVVNLGRSALHFEGPADARALAAACLKAAEEMDALPPAQDGSPS